MYREAGARQVKNISMWYEPINGTLINSKSLGNSNQNYGDEVMTRRQK